MHAKDPRSVLKLLLAREDIEVNSRDINGRAPLSFAAQCGFDGVRFLLARDDVEVNSKDNSGRTPLSFAEKAGERQMVRWLLARGATNSQDSNSE